MKEKLYNDLGLDNGEDILKKFNLEELMKKEDESQKNINEEDKNN